MSRVYRWSSTAATALSSAPKAKEPNLEKGLYRGLKCSLLDLGFKSLEKQAACCRSHVQTTRKEALRGIVTNSAGSSGRSNGSRDGCSSRAPYFLSSASSHPKNLPGVVNPPDRIIPLPLLEPHGIVSPIVNGFYMKYLPPWLLS